MYLLKLFAYLFLSVWLCLSLVHTVLNCGVYVCWVCMCVCCAQDHWTIHHSWLKSYYESLLMNEWLCELWKTVNENGNRERITEMLSACYCCCTAHGCYYYCSLLLHIDHNSNNEKIMNSRTNIHNRLHTLTHDRRMEKFRAKTYMVWMVRAVCDSANTR